MYGSPVLDLACGSGRLSIPIARDGREVVENELLARKMPLNWRLRYRGMRQPFGDI
jgi:2-polyprenyl-3-methyl-5-hydroxy-6-metoxy-1,4-benzoquinol methylase